MTVRREAPDGDPARSCLAAYFRELGERFEGGFELDASEAAALSEFRPPTGSFLVAYLDGGPVGCVGIKRLDGDTAEIKRMWTAPTVRGRGAARTMLQSLESWAREAGFTRLRLDTNRALKEAHAFYRREGFVEIGRYNDNPYAHLWFEKRL